MKRVVVVAALLAASVHGARGFQPSEPARLKGSPSNDVKVDLSKEVVGRAPATFEPMVGTWLVAQDGPDRVIMIDGRPWVASKDNPTKLLIESAIEALRTAMKGEDLDEIRRLTGELEQASYAMAEALYKQAGEAQAAADGAGAHPNGAEYGAETPRPEAGAENEDVIDAEFKAH